MFNFKIKCLISKLNVLFQNQNYFEIEHLSLKLNNLILK